MVDKNSTIDEKLDALAEAIEVLVEQYPEDFDVNEPEVQNDLRKWAEQLREHGILHNIEPS